MRSILGLAIVLTFLLGCHVVLAAPKDDIAKLSAYQRAMSDLTNDFVELSTRFQQSRDVKSSEVANTLGDFAQLTTLQLELLKDVVVGVGLLHCDQASQDYFRTVARQRIGDSGVPAFLDLKIREVSTWLSFSQDTRLIAQGNRLRDTLRNIREEVVSMKARYT